MRLLLLLCLCVLSNGCTNGDSYSNRNYVISKSQETAVDDDATEPEPE